jgi:four helix bundle protein
MTIRRYRDMKVWQRSMDLALAAYDSTDSFPAAERFGLTSQIRRAAVSIPSNIAEGQGRAHTGEFLNHLSIARGFLQEVETLLMIAERRHYLNSKQLDALLEITDHISRMLTRLRRSLST